MESWLVGRQADEIHLKFEIFQVCCKSKYSMVLELGNVTILSFIVIVS